MKLNENQLFDLRKKVMLSFFADDDLMDIFVLKGGNALQYVYKVTGRPSYDIDFSMENDFGENELPTIEKKIKNSLDNMLLPDKIKTFDLSFKEQPKESSRKNKRGTGYEIIFKLIPISPEFDKLSDYAKGVQSISVAGNKKTFKIDISKHEYCADKVEEEIDGYIIYVYSAKMIVLEKMRAICQQTKEYQNQEGTKKRPRPRDFYDIYMLCNKRNIDPTSKENIELLIHIFERKRVPLKLLGVVDNYKDYHYQGFSELVDTLPARERDITYNEIFSYVSELMKVINQNLLDRQDSTS